MASELKESPFQRLYFVNRGGTPEIVVGRLVDFTTSAPVPRRWFSPHRASVKEATVETTAGRRTINVQTELMGFTGARVPSDVVKRVSRKAAGELGIAFHGGPVREPRLLDDGWPPLEL